MLPAFEEAEPGVKLQIYHRRVSKRSGVELELEDFVAGAALSTQHAQTKRRGQPVPVGIDSDGRHTSAPILR